MNKPRTLQQETSVGDALLSLGEDRLSALEMMNAQSVRYLLSTAYLAETGSPMSSVRTVDFPLRRKSPDGTVHDDTVGIPLLSLVDLPVYQASVTWRFNYEISTTVRRRCQTVYDEVHGMIGTRYSPSEVKDAAMKVTMRIDADPVELTQEKTGLPSMS